MLSYKLYLRDNYQRVECNVTLTGHYKFSDKITNISVGHAVVEAQTRSKYLLTFSLVHYNIDIPTLIMNVNYTWQHLTLISIHDRVYITFY